MALIGEFLCYSVCLPYIFNRHCRVMFLLMVHGLRVINPFISLFTSLYSRRICRGWPQTEAELVRSEVRVLRPKAEDGVIVKRILPVIRGGRARPHAEEG